MGLLSLLPVSLAFLYLQPFESLNPFKILPFSPCHPAARFRIATLSIEGLLTCTKRTNDKRGKKNPFLGFFFIFFLFYSHLSILGSLFFFFFFFNLAFWRRKSSKKSSFETGQKKSRRGKKKIEKSFSSIFSVQSNLDFFFQRS